MIVIIGVILAVLAVAVMCKVVTEFCSGRMGFFSFVGCFILCIAMFVGGLGSIPLPKDDKGERE